MGGAPPVPFFAVLNALRDAGIPVDVRTHLAVGRFLDRYDGTSVDELVTALTSLIASDPRTAERVREMLRRSLTLEETPPPAPVEPMASSAAPRGSPMRLVALVAVLLAATGGLVWLMVQTGSTPKPSPPVPVIVPEALTELAVEPASCPELARPRPARSGLDLGLGTVLGLLALSALGLAWLTRRRAPAASSLVAGGTALRPNELVPPSAALPRDALHEIATVLGRLDETPAFDRIDIQRTIDRTSQQAGLPAIVWARHRPRAAALVIEEVGVSGSTLGAFADELIGRLGRDGVPIDHWYLHPGDLRCAPRPFAPQSVSLRSLATETQHLPLIVFADAARWTARRSGAERAELGRLLRGWSRRVWIVGASSSFAARNELRRAVGCPVFVGTPRGMKAAALSLAGRGVAQAGTGDVDADPDAVLLLGGLIAIAPTKSVEMARALRARFLPGATDALVDAVLPLIDPTRDPEERRAELAHAREALAERHPELEQAARAFFLRELDRGEPEAGTHQHLRWQVQRAIQQIASHDSREEGLQKLRELRKLTFGRDGARRQASRFEELPKLVRKSVDALAAAEVMRRPRAAGLGIAGGCLVMAGFVAVRGTGIGVDELPGAYTVTAEGDRLTVRRVVAGMPSDVELVSTGGPAVTLHLDNKGIAILPAKVAQPGCVRAQAVFAGGAAFSEDTRVVRTPVRMNIKPQENLAKPVKLRASFVDEETKETVAGGFTVTSADGTSLYGVAGADFLLKAGEWSLVASPAGYGSVAQKVTVDDRDLSLAIPVRRQRGTLEITSIPPAADKTDILVNDSSWSGERVVLPVGTARIKLSSDYYDDSEQTAEIRQDETTSVAVRPANARVYGVVVLSDVPTNAVVSSEEAEVLPRRRGVALRSFRPKATVTFSRLGIAAKTVEVIFEPGKTLTKTIKPVRSLATLSVSAPGAWVIEIDKANACKGESCTIQVAPGTYSVRATWPDGRASKVVQLREAEKRTVLLEPRQGPSKNPDRQEAP